MALSFAFISGGAAGGADLVYTAPVSRPVRIESIWIVNKDVSSQLYTLGVAVDGSTFGIKNHLISNRSIAVDDTHLYTAPIILAPGDFLKFICSSGSVFINAFGTVEGA